MRVLRRGKNSVSARVPPQLGRRAPSRSTKQELLTRSAKEGLVVVVVEMSPLNRTPDSFGEQRTIRTTWNACSTVPTWDFAKLPGSTANSKGDAGIPGSPLASGVATDEAQHDSSGDEFIPSPRQDFDADTDMDIPGASHYELGPAPEGDLPSYTEPPPPDYQAEISRDDMNQIWDQKQGVLNVPAGGEDQQSEEAAEIHLDDDDAKVRAE
jgi:hypothetical protein